MSDKRKHLETAQQLGERLRLAGYAERTYEHHMPKIAAQWRKSGDEALAELSVLVVKMLAAVGR